MGSFVPAAAMSVLQLGAQSAQRNLQIAQQKQQAELARATEEAQARGQIEQIQQSARMSERERQDAIKRALATQRARYGAQGIGAGGSADAVLAGMAAEAQRETQEIRKTAQLRINQIREQGAWQNTRNLLDASQFANRSAFNLVQQGLRTVPLLDF
jgi:hypothetical protein